MDETKQSGDQPDVVNTGGGHNVGGNVTAERDVVFGDVVTVIVEAQPRPEPSPLNSKELFSRAIRLQLAGMLRESLAVYQQIKAIDPYDPRISVEMAAIEAEIERGRRLRYVNDRGEIVHRALLETRAYELYLAGSGGVGKSHLIHGDLNSANLLIPNDIFVIPDFSIRRGKHTLEQYDALPPQRKQAKINFYFAEVNVGTELKEQHNRDSQSRVIVPAGAIVIVELGEDESFVEVKQDKELWTAIRYGNHAGWITSANLGRNTMVTFNKHYG
jgi:DNA-binding transcriptional regulator/RsmH inhibitor MraZ